MSRPLILVTNDDGVTAPGIQALQEAVLPLGDIVVVAPDKPQSGMGHAITINNTLRIQTIKHEGDYPIYSTTGTPVDCVKLAVKHILKRKPDLVVSGINHGSNSSINVIYSGTMSAAIEGSLEKIPSIGFSLMDYSIDANFDAAKKIANTIAKQVLEKGLPTGVCLNVNIPKLSLNELAGIKVCRQADSYYDENFDKRVDPHGREYFWLTGEFLVLDKSEDTDEWALANHYVSVVPCQYDLTAHQALENLKNWNLDV